jgi:hypothetical protein
MGNHGRFKKACEEMLSYAVDEEFGGLPVYETVKAIAEGRVHPSRACRRTIHWIKKHSHIHGHDVSDW